VQYCFWSKDQAWYAEFLLEIDLKILLRKTGVRLNFKITLISLHMDPGLICRDPSSILKFRLAPIFISKLSSLILSKNKHVSPGASFTILTFGKSLILSNFVSKNNTIKEKL
jgi:hypothetical protein